MKTETYERILREARAANAAAMSQARYDALLVAEEKIDRVRAAMIELSKERHHPDTWYGMNLVLRRVNAALDDA